MQIEITETQANPKKWVLTHKELTVTVRKVGRVFQYQGNWETIVWDTDTAEQAIDAAADLILSQIKTNYLAKVRQRTVITEDGSTVGIGDRVYNYYGMKPGTIVRLDQDGWFDLKHDDGTMGYLNGERVCTIETAATNGWK